MECNLPIKFRTDKIIRSIYSPKALAVNNFPKRKKLVLHIIATFYTPELEWKELRVKIYVAPVLGETLKHVVTKKNNNITLM